MVLVYGTKYSRMDQEKCMEDRLSSTNFTWSIREYFVVLLFRSFAFSNICFLFPLCLLIVQETELGASDTRGFLVGKRLAIFEQNLHFYSNHLHLNSTISYIYTGGFCSNFILQSGSKIISIILILMNLARHTLTICRLVLFRAVYL